MKTKPKALKKEDWKDKEGTHPSELWNFLPPYFLLWVIVIFGLLKKADPGTKS